MNPHRPRTGARGALSAAELTALVAQGKEQAVAGGGYLFREGDHLDRVFIIRSGLVALGRQQGSRRAVLFLLHDGEIAGDVPLLAGIPAPFDAMVVTDTTFVTIPAPVFLASLEENPAFAKRWVLSLGGRLAAWQARLDDLLAGDLRAQVVSLLLHEATAAPSIHLTQQLIANLLGARRTSVNRVLQALAREGIIELRYGQILVRDPDGLLTAAQPPAERSGVVIDLRDGRVNLRERAGDAASGS
jgi:CRP-like cAMP-binding protein